MWRFKTQAHAMADHQPRPHDHDAGAAWDGGLWRGPSEAGWIVQLLNGAPSPRNSAHSRTGLVAPG